MEDQNALHKEKGIDMEDENSNDKQGGNIYGRRGCAPQKKGTLWREFS